MVNGGCHLLISFVSLKQSTCLLVDNLGVFAAQQLIWYFLFYTTVSMFHPLPAVSSLLFVIVTVKDTTPLTEMDCS